MKRFSEQFNKKASVIKLQAIERKELRGRLVSYMEYHPLPASVATKISSGKKQTAYENGKYRVIRIPFLSVMKAGAAFAVVIMVGIPLLAEKTVPGDALYAVKVRFNEEVRSSLTLNSYKKVVWETERLNRRIAEAKLLASEGKLTEETEVSVAAAVREHTETINREIAELRIEDADQATLATLELNTTLEVQATSLRGEETDIAVLAKMVEPEESPTDFLIEVIDESIASQENAEATSIPPYEKIMARLEINTTRIYELLNSSQTNINQEIKSEVVRRLEDIGRGVQVAAEMRSSDETGAQKELLNLLQTSKKIIVFLTEMNIIDSTPLETIVPIVLTPEEEELKKAEWLGLIDKDLSIMFATQASTSVSLSEKIDFTVASIDEMKIKVATTTDFHEVKKLLTEVLQMTSDILLAINGEGISTSIEIITPIPTESEVLPTEPATTTGVLGTSTEASL